MRQPQVHEEQPQGQGQQVGALNRGAIGRGEPARQIHDHVIGELRQGVDNGAGVLRRKLIGRIGALRTK